MDWNIQNLLLNARKPAGCGKLWGYKNQLPLLTLLHFSDVHGDGVAMKRLCDFIEEYGEYIEDSICTGDVLVANWHSDFNFWDQNGRAKNILSCIGNHDILGDKDGWNWQKRASQEECFQKLFAPYIENWGCVYEENKTYYYKDYPDNKIRLIVLDSGLVDAEKEEQLVWLENVLNDALEKELHICAGMHYPVYMKKIPCKFSTLDRKDGFGDKAMDVYQEKVDAFIKKGGDFVVWLTGHMHIDYIGYNENYPDQLCIAIDSLNAYQSNAYNDGWRQEDMPSHDLYNLVTIDTFDKMIKIIRIGNDLDRFMRKKDTLCINYKTFEIIE